MQYRFIFRIFNVRMDFGGCVLRTNYLKLNFFETIYFKLQKKKKEEEEEDVACLYGIGKFHFSSLVSLFRYLSHILTFIEIRYLHNYRETLFAA